MTPIQKLTAILEGILGQAPTNPQLLKVSNAFLDSLTDSEIQSLFEKVRADVTNAEKASLVVKVVRNLIKHTVSQAPFNIRNREEVTPADVSDL